MFPDESVAITLIVCVPLVNTVVFHEAEYGDVVSVTGVVVSIWMDTLDTATLSVAVADITTAVPDTVAPLVGVVIDTVGGVVSVTGGVIGGGVVEPPEIWYAPTSQEPERGRSVGVRPITR